MKFRTLKFTTLGRYLSLVFFSQSLSLFFLATSYYDFTSKSSREFLKKSLVHVLNETCRDTGHSIEWVVFVFFEFSSLQSESFLFFFFAMTIVTTGDYL